MTSTLVPLLTACVEGKAQHDGVIIRPDGSPVRDFRGTWDKVRTAAESPKRLFHDLRRTAARSLRRVGVAEGVIMNIGGWKTRSIFERYTIVAPSDIKDAMGNLEQQRRNTEEAKKSDIDRSSAIVAQKTQQSGEIDKE